MAKINQKTKKVSPKWFYYLFLGISLFIIIFLILGGIYPAYSEQKCDADNRCYGTGYTYNSMLEILWFLIFIPLAVIGLLSIIFILAKNYELKSLTLPVISIIPFLLVFIDFTGISRIQLFWIYSIVGVCISLFFIWKK